MTQPKPSTASSTSSPTGAKIRSVSSCAASLGAIVAQRLIPKIGGGRVAAFEVLIANHPVRNLIREGKSNQLMNVMTTNQAEGMRTMESSLATLINADVITYEVRSKCPPTRRKSLGPWATWSAPQFRYDGANARTSGTGICPIPWWPASRRVPRVGWWPAPSSLARPLRPRTEDHFDLRRSARSTTDVQCGRGQRPHWLSRPVDARRRACDREARSLLGRRGAAVHSAPGRSTVEEGGTGTEENLDAVTKELLPRYREVAMEMAPYRQRTVYEVHSRVELLSTQRGMRRCATQAQRGRMDERRSRWRKDPRSRPDSRRAVREMCPIRISSTWQPSCGTARRIFARAAMRVPADPEWDSEGIRMEIVR